MFYKLKVHANSSSSTSISPISATIPAHLPHVSVPFLVILTIFQNLYLLCVMVTFDVPNILTSEGSDDSNLWH